MPLYEFECANCSHRFERLQRFSDPPPESCPKCGGPVTQIMSAPAIQFKGTGWYVTDYARKSSSPHAKPAASANKPGNGNGSSSAAASSPATTGAVAEKK